MEKLVLEAEKRETCNSRFARAVRRQGKIPGVIYGQNRDTLPVIFDEKQATKFVHRETAMITVRLSGEDIKGIIRDVQFDPVTDNVLHIDIMSVDITQKVRVSVPVVLEGEPESVKTGGILEHITREIEIECLPMDMPKHITVNVSNLEIGCAVHAEDIKLDKIKVLTRSDKLIVAVVPPKVEKAAAVAEVEETTEEEQLKTQEEGKKE